MNIVMQLQKQNNEYVFGLIFCDSHHIVSAAAPCVSLLLSRESRLRILFTGHNQITHSNANSSYESKLKPVLKDKHKASYLLVFSQRVDAFALCMVVSQRPHESNGQQCFCYRNLTQRH